MSEAIVATLDGDLQRAVRVSQQLIERADGLGAPVAGRKRSGCPYASFAWPWRGSARSSRSGTRGGRGGGSRTGVATSSVASRPAWKFSGGPRHAR
jgi:hypothetical protein